MKLAVSNLAWPVAEDEAVAKLLSSLGISGIEVAPTKLWPAPLETPDAELDRYRQTWEARGFSIVAAQALLFGHPELTLFESAETRAKTLAYLEGMIRVCARLGAKALVFGSPKNRRMGDRDPAEIAREAIPFFRRLGEAAAAAGTAIVMEANPPEYGADYVTRAGEAIDLVRAVNHPGFRLHLDSACMAMIGDAPAQIVPQAGELLRHFHISEPNLAAIGSSLAGGPFDHAPFAGALRAAGYSGWISVEMREPSPFSLEALARSLTHAQAAYGPSPR